MNRGVWGFDAAVLVLFGAPRIYCPSARPQARARSTECNRRSCDVRDEVHASRSSGTRKTYVVSGVAQEQDAFGKRLTLSGEPYGLRSVRVREKRAHEYVLSPFKREWCETLHRALYTSRILLSTRTPHMHDQRAALAPSQAAPAGGCTLGCGCCCSHPPDRRNLVGLPALTRPRSGFRRSSRAGGRWSRCPAHRSGCRASPGRRRG